MEDLASVNIEILVEELVELVVANKKPTLELFDVDQDRFYYHYLLWLSSSYHQKIKRSLIRSVYPMMLDIGLLDQSNIDSQFYAIKKIPPWHNL